MLVLKTGHCIRVGPKLTLHGPPAHIPVIGQHYQENKAEHTHGNKHCAGRLPALLIKPVLNKFHPVFIVLLHLACFVIIPYFRLYLRIRRQHCLPHPYEGYEQNKTQKDYPYNNRRSEPSLIILPKHQSEGYETKHAPRDKEKEGFLGDRSLRDKIGDQEIGSEEDHKDKTGKAQISALLILIFVADLHGGSGNHSIYQSRSYCRNIHYPSYGGSAGKRNEY